MTLSGFFFFLFVIAFTSAQIVRPGKDVYRLPNAQVLATQHEIANNSHPLRVAVDDGEQRAIRYLFLDSNVLSAGYPEPFSIDLPHLPPGDWNEAHIHLDSHNMTPSIANTTRRIHLGMMDTWHPIKIELLDFANVETLQQDRLQIVTHPFFDGPVLIKIAGFPSEIPSLEQEAAIYRALHGSKITPEFLGHVTEGGRAIGFITQYIREVPSIRHNRVGGCLNTLSKLHERGIAHGDAHDGNCLIREDGEAVLIDFELALETTLPEEFERDMDTMGRCVRAISEAY